MPTRLKESDREKISSAQLQQFQQEGSVIVDDRRRRPLWFDGRFLDADALDQQQQYYIAKQEDVAQLLGSGVVSGLLVDLVEENSRTLVIREGRGFTPSGKLVLLEEDVIVDMADMARIQEMNLAFELSQKPSPFLSNSSGIFIIALRPVEYTAAPISAYPTEINGQRSVEDSSVFEATAISLIPYTDQGASTELSARRKHISHEIFFNKSQKGQPANVLPLAVVALNMGVVEWLDPYLVRRDMAAQKHELFGLGLSPRVLREAHLLQYQRQLNQILEQRQNTAFSAVEEFLSLPPAGPMPLAAVNIDDFTQTWFPVGIDVELSIIPDDELYMMLDESFSMTPIDLSLTEQQFQGSPVLVLLAVPRHKIRALSLTLPSLINPLKSVAADAVSGNTPIELLTQLGIDDEDLGELESADSVWREAFQDAEVQLWYTRRRNINFKTEIIGEPVSVLSDEESTEDDIDTLISDTGSVAEFSALNTASTIAARAEVSSLLGKVRSSPLIFRSALSEFTVRANDDTNNRLKKLSAIRVSERFSENKLGEGVARLQSIASDYDDDTDVAESVVRSGKVPELDKLARRLNDSDLRVFSNRLIDSVSTNSGPQPDTVAQLVEERISELNALNSAAR